jgi:hypothetical protein
MRKRRIKLLNKKYIIAYYIKINKGTKVFQQSKIICTIPVGERFSAPVSV